MLLSRSPGGRGEARQRGKSRRRTSGLAQVHDEVPAGFGRGDTPLNKEEKDDICEDNEVK